MLDQRLQHFSRLVAVWSLEDAWLANMLSQIPRRASEESFSLVWQFSATSDWTLVFGSRWTELEALQKQALARLHIHHLLLGHLSMDVPQKQDLSAHVARFAQAFHYLPIELQQTWPSWQEFWVTLDVPTHPGLEEIKQMIEDHVLDRFEVLVEQVSDRQSFWRQPFGKKANPKASAALLFRQIKAQLLQTGNIGMDSWQVWVSLTQKRQGKALPWTSIFRRYIRQYRRRKLDFTHKRISKRYGTSPGIRLKNEARIGVVLDTSASVSEALLAQFYEELGVLDRLGHEILVVEADTEIRAVYPFRKRQKTKLFTGRGNTSYDAAISYFSKQRVDLLLYFTDGLGPAPLVTGPPLIWIIYHPEDLHLFLQEKMKEWEGEKVFIFSYTRT